MARPEKEAQVRSIQEKLRNSTSVVLTEFRGLTVHELAELRRKLREQEVEYKVVKNTLAQIAANEVGDSKRTYCADCICDKLENSLRSTSMGE